MESNWRIGVMDTGLNFTPVTLIARSLEVDGWWLTNRKHATQNWYAYYWDPGGVHGYEQTGAYAIPQGNPHFPYGHAVDPDAPM